MKKDPSSERYYLPQGSQVGNTDPVTLKKEHERFQKRLSRVLKGSLGLASNKQELEQCIRKAGQQPGGSEKLGELAAAEFSGAAEGRETFKRERTSGIKGASATFQESLFAVSRFAAAYSSLLEAVSKTAGPYAEIGYQTMTILLIVFVNKTKHVIRIGEHLDRIQKILPRLETWKGLYQNERMEELVSITYHQVIQFSRSVAEYFSRRWQRIWLALNPLAMSSKFDDPAQSIYEASAEVNAEANQSLHARSENIERTVLDLKGTNAVLQASLADLQTKLDERDRQADDENFRILEEGLSPNASQSSSSCFDLSLAKSVLKKAFPNVKGSSNAISWSTYTLMTPARILSHPSFQAWADLQESALLFIHGGTRREGRASTVTMPCWLSPAAVHIIEHLLRSGNPGIMRDRIVYFSCRPDRETSVEKAADVLMMVALRLLSTRKDILRERLRDFQKLTLSMSPIPSRTSSPALSRPPFSPSWSQTSSPGLGAGQAGNDQYDTDPVPGSPSKPASAFKKSRLFLREVLKELSQREGQTIEEEAQKGMTAYIVLDRLDYIDDNVKLTKFLRELGFLIAEKGAFRIKIVAVAEARLQENRWKNDLPENHVNSNQVFEAKMDQRELSSRDMAGDAEQLLWEDESTGK